MLNAEAPLVFAIDAPWGGGKTTFIRLWQHYLQQPEQNKVSLYLNAWESDFAEDPLLPMLAVLDNWLTEQSDKPAVKVAWEKAKSYAPGILKSTAVAAAKVATFGALDLDKEYEKLASELAGGAVSSLVDSFNIKQKSLEHFKIQLGAALEALPEEQQNLIVFVDELDRCKPTYAIEVLERIKHLFDIDRLVFVLAINRDQLSKSLQGVYGPSFDGMHYLKRFIDLDYHLRVPDIQTYISATLQQDDLQAYFASRQSESKSLDTFTKVLRWLGPRFKYTPRDIDQVITRIRLIVRSIPASNNLDAVVLLSMLILRQENVGLYRRFVADALCANEVIEYFLGGKFDEVELPEFFGAVAGWLIRSGYDDFNEMDLSPLISPWEELFPQLEDTKDTRSSEVRVLLTIVKGERGVWGQDNIRQITHDRIELVDQINVSLS